MIDYIYNVSGSPVGFTRKQFVYELSGRPVGQLHKLQVHTLSGEYVGDLYLDTVVDRGRRHPGNIRSTLAPDPLPFPGHPGHRGHAGHNYPDVFVRLLRS